MKMRGWLLHSGIFGFGQNTRPWACRSAAATSTTEGGGLIGGCGSDPGEPFEVLRVAAVHDVEERGLDLLGDRTARAAPDLDAVEFADRRDFGGGAGEERLVGDVDLVARDALFHQRDVQVAADREDRVARDAVERARRQVGR